MLFNVFFILLLAELHLPTSSIPTDKCQSDGIPTHAFFRIGSICYYRQQFRVYPSMAKSFCEDDGTSLLTIPTAEVNANLYSWLTGKFYYDKDPFGIEPTTPSWRLIDYGITIGLENHDGNWTWLDGTPMTYNNFAPKELQTEQGNCSYFGRSGQWYRSGCDWNRYDPRAKSRDVICQFKLSGDWD